MCFTTLGRLVKNPGVAVRLYANPPMIFGSVLFFNRTILFREGDLIIPMMLRLQRQ